VPLSPLISTVAWLAATPSSVVSNRIMPGVLRQDRARFERGIGVSCSSGAVDGLQVQDHALHQSPWRTV
jgi:hypothetical protein